MLDYINSFIYNNFCTILTEKVTKKVLITGQIKPITYIYIYIYICMCVCVCVCVYIYVYIYMCIYIYVYIYVYVYKLI